MDALMTPAVECLKCSMPPFVRQISYFIHYKKNVEKLASKLQVLNNTKMDVQNRVTAAKRNLESIKKVVEAWLEKVENETNSNNNLDVQTLMMRLLNNGDEAAAEETSSCCCCTRYNIGRRARKKIVIIDELVNEGNSFVHDDVSYPSCPTSGMELMPITGDIVAFESREFTKDQVVKALNDEGTYIVGIYGMGGVGKTTLMYQVRKQVIQEKIFDAVVLTTVSQNVELKRIQVEIAEQLGLERLKEVDDKLRRAAMLYERLKQEKRILVILDDMWTTASNLDLLSDVGIPCGENDRQGCKIVITTRSLEVCNSSLSQKNIEVGILSEEDSWKLFKKNVGDVLDAPELQTVAGEVVGECGGLPLALVTLGRALRNKSEELVWNDTALQLRRSNFTYLEGMNSKVFSSIKLSYDYLGNEILKRCFLLCSLFPEDYIIPVEKLVMYLTGDEMILEDLETMKQVRSRLQIVLDKLIASCLLIPCEEKRDGVIYHVKMHDVVRDVAIAIASEESNGFFVKAGMGLRNWPERSRLLSLGKCLRMSVMKNEISVLPDQPQQLPKLLSLSLEENYSLQNVPDSFFQSMETLLTLDISRTGISLLPSSISCLINLRSLDLGWCHFHETDISIVGKLKKLEILNLSGCGLSSLPEEIGGLQNLRILHLSKNSQIKTIPPNVISRLSRLEELYMSNTFSGWTVKQTGDGSSSSSSSSDVASLDEVASLTCLNTLQLEVFNDGINSFISFGCGFNNDTNISCGNCTGPGFDCFLTASTPIYHSIKVLLAKGNNLLLSNCTGLKSLWQLVTGFEFNKTKRLSVAACIEMEYIMSVGEGMIPTNTFAALEELYLGNLFMLKHILLGPMPAGFLVELKLLHVEKCKNLVGIFPTDMLMKLRNLEVLRVEKCGELKEAFYTEERWVNKERRDSNVGTFPAGLRELYLRQLPKLMSIWNGVNSSNESLRNLEVIEVISCQCLRYLFTPAMVPTLQKLEKLMICECDGMVTIVEDDQGSIIPPRNSTSIPEEVLFPNLRELVIKGCNSLKNLNPLTKLHRGGLSQLKLLEVKDCESLEEFMIMDINEKDQGEKENHEIAGSKKAMLPRLERLVLENLPCLMIIWKGTIPIGSLQTLREVIIRNCGDSLRHPIFPVRFVMAGGLSQLEILNVTGCKGLEAVIGHNYTTTHVDDSDQQLRHQKHCILLPRLRQLVLNDLPNLVTIARGVTMSVGSLENLEELMVERCDNMKHLLPMRLLVNGGLPKLDYILVGNCNEMEVIFHLEDGGDQYSHNEIHNGMMTISSAAFPCLSVLQLGFLPKLSSFHQGPAIIEWPSLELLEVVRCENLKRLPLSNHHSLPKLKVIIGDSEEWFNDGLEWEDQVFKSCLRPLFTVVTESEEPEDEENIEDEEDTEDRLQFCMKFSVYSGVQEYRIPIPL